jgi:hypothetical protein
MSRRLFFVQFCDYQLIGGLQLLCMELQFESGTGYFIESSMEGFKFEQMFFCRVWALMALFALKI